MTGLGGMRERPNRMVSKTIVAQVTLGSNPSPSATAGAPGQVDDLARSALRSPSAWPNDAGRPLSNSKTDERLACS